MSLFAECKARLLPLQLTLPPATSIFPQEHA
jgi:hypothetical protein